MNVLVVNAGSSSVKFALYGGPEGDRERTGMIDWNTRPRESDRQAIFRDELGRFLGGEQVQAVGHRVVHGGTLFGESTRITSSVKSDLDRLSELAPLHNPPALEALALAESMLPNVPHVAVFDTGFFASLAPTEYVYPLPFRWHEEWGIRRFGFHGISHAYCAVRAAEFLSRSPEGLHLVVCHLGNGCSATAVSGGKATATTMGFTPLEGLMMGSRSGSVDPSILLHVQRKHGLSAEEMDRVLNRESGLLGISGVSSDYRQVEAASQAGNSRAQLALAIYAQRVRSTIGALAVTIGGVDVLVFTAGVGEHSASLRDSACSGLECLGLHLDQARNQTARADCDVATPDSRGRILVLHTREEFLIARETRRLVAR